MKKVRNTIINHPWAIVLCQRSTYSDSSWTPTMLFARRLAALALAFAGKERLARRFASAECELSRSILGTSHDIDKEQCKSERD